MAERQSGRRLVLVRGSPQTAHPAARASSAYSPRLCACSTLCGFAKEPVRKWMNGELNDVWIDLRSGGKLRGKLHVKVKVEHPSIRPAVAAVAPPAAAPAPAPAPAPSPSYGGAAGGYGGAAAGGYPGAAGGYPGYGAAAALRLLCRGLRGGLRLRARHSPHARSPAHDPRCSLWLCD